jgi:hypothetical protein
MSNLLAIYDALAALPLTFDGQPLPVYLPDDLPSAIHNAHLPARLLLSGRSTVQSMTPLTMSGARSAVLWLVTDLFLFAPIAQGRAVGDAASALARYESAYLSTLRPRLLLTPNAVITQVLAQAGAFAYPDGSSTRFSGVEARLLVREVTS